MRMRLILTVDYKEGTITELEAKTLLTAVAFRADADGLLTGNEVGVMEDWEYRTERLPNEEKEGSDGVQS